MSIIEKLAEARKFIKSKDLKKMGHNSYSGYDYYLPEQIGAIVYEACSEVGLLTTFELKRSELGYIGELTLHDLGSEDSKTFKMATDIPAITATNATQQIGGAMTYTERYLKMTVFDIQDNSLDFDSKDNRQKIEKSKKEQKPWLNKGTEQYDKVVEYLQGGGLLEDVKKKYSISKAIEAELIKL